MLEIGDNELASKLRESISRIVKVMKREIRQDEQLSLTERSTLSLINRNFQILPSELARVEHVSTQAMSQIINKLLRLGLIQKTPSKEDRRKVFILATIKGQELIEQKRNKTSEWLAKVISEKCSDEEKMTLAQSANIIAKLVE